MSGFYIAVSHRVCRPAHRKGPAHLFLPVAIVLFGLFNIKDTLRDYRRSMQQRKYGSFTSDDVRPWEDKYYPRLEALRTGASR